MIARNVQAIKSIDGNDIIVYARQDGGAFVRFVDRSRTIEASLSNQDAKDLIDLLQRTVVNAGDREPAEPADMSVRSGR